MLQLNKQGYAAYPAIENRAFKETIAKRPSFGLKHPKPNSLMELVQQSRPFPLEIVFSFVTCKEIKA